MITNHSLPQLKTFKRNNKDDFQRNMLIEQFQYILVENYSWN